MSQTGQLAENLYYSYDQDELGFCACGNIATVKWSVAVGAPTFKVTCRNPDCLPPRFALPFPRQEHGPLAALMTALLECAAEPLDPDRHSADSAGLESVTRRPTPRWTRGHTPCTASACASAPSRPPMRATPSRPTMRATGGRRAGCPCAARTRPETLVPRGH